MAGQIQTFVFDKTGTLTEEGLSVLGFRPTQSTEEAKEGEQRSGGTTSFKRFTDDAGTLAPKGTWWSSNGAD